MGEGDVGQVSPDGKWYWDGRSWMSAVSPDGKSRWDGQAWVTVKSPRDPAYIRPWLIGGGLAGGAAAILVAAVVVAAMVIPSTRQTAQVQSPRPSQHASTPLAIIGSTPSPSPSLSPSHAPSPSLSPKPPAKASPKPSAKPLTKPSTCGAPANPWGYNFCHGTVIYSPPSAFCSYFPCISSFGNSPGYVIECKDGKYSTAGGRSGACSTHGGIRRALYKP